MAYQLIYNNKFMVGFNPANPPMTEVGTLAGKSIKVMNMTQYGLSIYAAGLLLDYIPAYQFVIMENRSDLYVQLDSQNTVPYVYPNANVAVKTIEEKLSYQIGIMIQTQQPGDVQNIAGDVNMTGTVNANIQNTPNVSITGTPSVEIANASLPITGNVTASISGGVNATIQNANLNTQVTNALLSTGPSASGQTSYPLTLAAGASTSGIAVNMPASFYDSCVIYMKCNNNGVTFSSKYSVNFYFCGVDAAYSDPAFQPVNPVVWETSQAYGAVSLPIPLTKTGKSIFANQFFFMITNNSGAAITDTITFNVYAKYAAQTVTNQSNQPVPTSSNYYGTGADGVFNTSGNVGLGNPANAPAIYNYTSFTINSGHTVSFNNLAKYVLIYCTGDVTINGTLNCPGGMTNLTDQTQLVINGKNVGKAGNGGNGGSAPGQNGTSAGGTGGIGNCYSAGAGGGGGGGQLGGSGASGGTGFGQAPGGGTYNAGDPNYHPAPTPGGSAPTWNSGTLCIVAGGTITINGTIFGPGYNGGNGGNGWYGQYTSGSNFGSFGGGGGSSGPNGGGTGSIVANGSSNTYGGGGAGGSGGASIFLFSGGATFVNGTINTNAGGGGSGGGGTVSGNPGTAGTAGSVVIWQLGGNGGGL